MALSIASLQHPEPGELPVFAWHGALAQCGNIRIDTHRNNIPMQKTLIKNGYRVCGTIYLENGDERIAFQKEQEN